MRKSILLVTVSLFCSDLADRPKSVLEPENSFKEACVGAAAFFMNSRNDSAWQPTSPWADFQYLHRRGVVVAPARASHAIPRIEQVPTTANLGGRWTPFFNDMATEFIIADAKWLEEKYSNPDRGECPRMRARLERVIVSNDFSVAAVEHVASDELWKPCRHRNESRESCKYRKMNTIVRVLGRWDVLAKLLREHAASAKLHVSTKYTTICDFFDFELLHLSRRNAHKDKMIVFFHVFQTMLHRDTIRCETFNVHDHVGTFASFAVKHGLATTVYTPNLGVKAFMSALSHDAAIDLDARGRGCDDIGTTILIDGCPIQATECYRTTQNTSFVFPHGWVHRANHEASLPSNEPAVTLFIQERSPSVTQRCSSASVDSRTKDPGSYALSRALYAAADYTEGKQGTLDLGTFVR